MDGRSTKSESLTGRPRQYYSFDHYETHSWEETESLEEERHDDRRGRHMIPRTGVEHKDILYSTP